MPRILHCSIFSLQSPIRTFTGNRPRNNIDLMKPTIAIKTCGPVFGSIRPPGSKSITNRALLCAALGEGASVLKGALDSDDTRYMVEAWRQLQVKIEAQEQNTQLVVHGCNGRIPSANAELFIGNSGTSVRFLTAAVTIGNGTDCEYRLDGVSRMRERPIEDLLHALRQLGVDARSELGTDCPPVVVATAGLQGGIAKIAGNISSQYLSGLLMASPYAKKQVQLKLDGALVSKPYVDMTLSVMRSFGGMVTTDDDSYLVSNAARYSACEYSIEPDASAASYFWATAAITGGRVSVEGLSRDALQGDVGFVDCLEKMGCQVETTTSSIAVQGRPLHGVDLDMNAVSDTVQTLAAVALFADGPTTIRGVAHNRHKETDRIGDLATELRKTGATVTETTDGMVINPPDTVRSATFETYDDHRMAMSLALIGLRVPGVVINDPGCTSKTYPNFFVDLETLAGTGSNSSAQRNDG